MIQMLAYIVWNLQPDLQLGSISIHLYGLMFALGLVAGGLVVIRLMQSQTETQSYLLYAFVGIVVGARLFHCLLYDPNYYLGHPIEMFLPVEYVDDKWRFGGFWGLASHGGVVGLMVALLIYSYRHKVAYLRLCDIFAIATPLTGAFIRLGNLMNSEILGRATDLPIGFVFARIDAVPRHPATLYEALWYFILFAMLAFIYKRYGFGKFKDGFYTGIAFVGVALFRLFIEFLKEPQENYIHSLPLNVGQLLSIPFIVAGIAMIWVYGKRR